MTCSTDKCSAVSRWIFGSMADGRSVEAVRLSRPGGLALELLTLGATVHRLTAPAADGLVEAVAGYPALQGYEGDTGFFGAIVGRCANRIGGACFSLDGRTVKVSANEGSNCLHGGVLGFNKRLWAIETPDPDRPRAVLTYVSADGEEGFPGEVRVRADYELTAEDTLCIAYEATTDRTTPVNLSQHIYFNLSGWKPVGGDDILDHVLQISGAAITPVRGDLIPTGDLLPVAGTPFDLRRGRSIGEALAEPHPQLAIPGGFDMNWALDPANGPALTLTSPKTGLSLTIETDQLGMQVYSGQALPAPFAKHAALALEPQGFPDAVNHPNFPSVILRPGQTYRHRSVYRFSSDLRPSA
jgi:aldose 1-epimerase